MGRLKQFFLTGINPINLNRSVWMIFLILSTLLLLCSLILIGVDFSFLLLLLPATIGDELVNTLAPFLKWQILSLLFNSIAGILIALLMSARKKPGWYLFIFFNVLIILESSIYSFFMGKVIARLMMFLNSGFAGQLDIYRLMNQWHVANLIQLLLVISIHLWIIWRYWQPDMKFLFGILSQKI